jgi:hypothetical protein
MSKLYTEEQVRKAWNTAYADALALDDENYKPKFYSDFIASLTPIQLPTDEEIDDIALDTFLNGSKRFGFIEGAKWMRDKIGGQDNE